MLERTNALIVFLQLIALPGMLREQAVNLALKAADSKEQFVVVGGGHGISARSLGHVLLGVGFFTNNVSLSRACVYLAFPVITIEFDVTFVMYAFAALTNPLMPGANTASPI